MKFVVESIVSTHDKDGEINGAMVTLHGSGDYNGLRSYATLHLPYASGASLSLSSTFRLTEDNPPPTSTTDEAQA